MKKEVLILLIGIIFGFCISNIADISFYQPAKAEVAGMDSYDLIYDYDFKRAVKEIVEDSCKIDTYDNEISCR